MSSKAFKGLSSKSFSSLKLKSLLKALPARKPLKNDDESFKTESFSTIDFAACVIENQVDNHGPPKLPSASSEYDSAPHQSVTLMTFSKVVDIFEELAPLPAQEIPKPRNRARRNSFLKMKSKKSSRPNTAVEAIISSGILESALAPLTPENRMLRRSDSEHLSKARAELLLQEETSKFALLKTTTPSARENRLKYRTYTPPLDCFELQRRMNRKGCDEKIYVPRLDPSSYAYIMRKEEYRRRMEDLAYRKNPYLLRNEKHIINNGVRSLKLESIPESVGSWSVSKDPRDPRQRRTKLEYIVTSW
ncbi:hypothetical protein PCASD_01597 [Puccinia coronata f. sp. avenae]|uniref:Uncharacterized protein n=1 Tax=Puccinia coronata f. sp. avenae TaxID=200324 RepID=A0A2N5VII0_9BASI|nr:hypothetical protein PCASD_01597 [Puccinia coronata f. sp. avenae]